jgi:16S rRNA (cytosine967-C5)-methyltransferase
LPKTGPSKREPPAGQQSPRRLAHAVLTRVDTTQAYSDRVLDTALDRATMSDQDRSLATELVYGTLRHLPALDHQLNLLLTEPVTKLPLPVRAALRLGAYQLLHMRMPAYSAVNESVQLVTRRYGKLMGLANAVLRKLATQKAALDAEGAPMPDVPPADWATHFSHPLWLVQLMRDELGDADALALLTQNNTPPKLALRVNLRATTRAALQQRLADHGVACEASPFCPESLILPPCGAVTALPGFAEGHFAVQDVAATLVGRLLDPTPGATVLDLCAAPGGKATHALELMDDSGQVIAVDVHPGRMQRVLQNAERLGLAHLTPLVTDLTDLAASSAALKALGVTQAPFVLLDAPCSALGTLRRHPELRHREAEVVPRLTQLQATLLDHAATWVAPGGVLVYAVCTWTQREGPQQIASFLARHPEFTLAKPKDTFAAVTENDTLRCWPHKHGLDGFFAARLVRSAITLRPSQPIP